MYREALHHGKNGGVVQMDDFCEACIVTNLLSPSSWARSEIGLSSVCRGTAATVDMLRDEWSAKQT